MVTVTPNQIISVIKGVETIVSNAPAIKNAGQYVIQNGIKKGGYEVITAAWNNMVSDYGSVSNMAQVAFGGKDGLAEIGNSAFNGLKNQFGSVSEVAEKAIENVGNQIEPVTNTSVSTATSTAINSFGAMMSNIGSAAAKGGVAGIVVGMTIETIASFEKYKSGEISSEEYVKEIALSGAEMGISGAATAGIMVPVTMALGSVGLATAPVTIPISIVLGAGINKIVAPAFGKGEYKEILGEAKYYQNLMESHADLVKAIIDTENQFAYFIGEIQSQEEDYNRMRMMNRQIWDANSTLGTNITNQSNSLNKKLDSLDSILNQI